MHDNEPLVYGEQPGVLCVAIRRIVKSVSPLPDGTYQWSGPLEELGLPFGRALYRAEAEILTEEADALERQGAIPRTEAQRKMAAFARISERVHPDPSPSLS